MLRILYHKINIFVVPKVYAFEIKNSDQLYIDYFFRVIEKNHVIFFCGKKIIARMKNDLIKPVEFKNKIVFWDNVYANDYCPRKLMLGPWKYREKSDDIMINPTGLIETDFSICNTKM